MIGGRSSLGWGGGRPGLVWLEGTNPDRTCVFTGLGEGADPMAPEISAWVL